MPEGTVPSIQDPRLVDVSESGRVLIGAADAIGGDRSATAWRAILPFRMQLEATPAVDSKDVVFSYIRADTWRYVVETSSDLISWVPVAEDRVLSSDLNHRREDLVRIDTVGSAFFRLRAVPNND